MDKATITLPAPGLAADCLKYAAARVPRVSFPSSTLLRLPVSPRITEMTCASDNTQAVDQSHFWSDGSILVHWDAPSCWLGDCGSVCCCGACLSLSQIKRQSLHVPYDGLRALTYCSNYTKACKTATDVWPIPSSFL